MSEEEKVLNQLIGEIEHKLKDKHGQIESCSCIIHINITTSNVRQNIQACQYMTMYIDEYISLCKEYLSLQKQLINLKENEKH